MVDDLVFFFGGADIDGNIFNDLHVLDCTLVNLSNIIEASQQKCEQPRGPQKSIRSRSSSVFSAEGLPSGAAGRKLKVQIAR